jgi:hypothetical protein
MKKKTKQTNSYKKRDEVRCQRLMPVILANQEAEIRRIVV